MGIQTITTPAGEDMVIMPRSEYEALLAAAEDAFEDGADAATFAAALEQGAPDDVLPPEISAAILAGKGRLRAFRDWRGIDIDQLSRACGIDSHDIAAIENGERLLNRETAARLSQALSLPSAWLEP